MKLKTTSFFSTRMLATLLVAAALLNGPVAGATERGELVEALRAGGLVLYFRHAPTDWLDDDQLTSEGALSSCDRDQMRQLSDEGRDTARAVGEAIRTLKIPVASVYASEYCRTTETARLLALAPVETGRDVLNVRAAQYVGGREALAAKARTRLSTPPPAGSNVVLVGHGNVLMLLADVHPPEAGAAVVRPLGDGKFEVLGILAPQDWVQLAQDRASAKPCSEGARGAGERLPELS